MTPNGPLYCETGHPWLFMAEPVNTVTNGFIILAGVYAYIYVRRARVGMPLDLSVLLFLLFATGIGSFAWHAFRTRIALAFDAIPGVLFLLVMSGLWFRALWGNWAGVLGAIGVVAVAAGAPYLWWHGAAVMPPRALVFAPAFFAIAAMGAVLAALSVPRYGAGIAALGGFAILSAVTAAASRSVDLLVCDRIPIGSHWIWHMTLSLAAYLGIVMLTRMKLTRAGHGKRG
jgi:Ceramidase